MVRDVNKVTRLQFCLKIVETNDDFGNIIFTDESSVEIERATTIQFHKAGEMYKPAPKPKHPLKVISMKLCLKLGGIYLVNSNDSDICRAGRWWNISPTDTIIQSKQDEVEFANPFAFHSAIL